MIKRIFRSTCLVAVAVLVASLILVMGVQYEYFAHAQQTQLSSQLDLAKQGVIHEGMGYLEDLSVSGSRVTWIAADGTVLYDNQSDWDDMENHLEREEIQEALALGHGSSRRYSPTMMEQFLYEAARLPDGSVLRLSTSQHSLVTLLMGMLPSVGLVLLLALILALVLASHTAKRVVEPLNQLDLDHPLSNVQYDELAPLLRRIGNQQKQLSLQESELRRKKDEFDAVTASMNEGLALLNQKGYILSINPKAAALLGADKTCVGADLMTVNRSLQLQKLLHAAQGGQRAECVMELGGGRYQLEASPVISDGSVSGVALLMFDVTEREQAEQMRREFTANVSHELKTPLHTISGCAELMMQGLIKPEDEKQFATQMYQEAQRMIHLVEDILRLSRLDEGAEDMTRENVDLYALTQTAVESLRPNAQEAGVTLHLEGESVNVEGIPQLLSVIAFNLCDNAIKYNRRGGSVDVRVYREGTDACLMVKDTGIGIPPEDQSRIFERFYRVDKSHSKEVGGTGLGLSIVKHAAMIHQAKIEMHSVVGEGTTMTVRFP